MRGGKGWAKCRLAREDSGVESAVRLGVVFGLIRVARLGVLVRQIRAI